MTTVNYFYFAQNTTFHVSTEWRQLSINGPMDWLSARCGDQLLQYHAFIGMNLSKDNYCPTGGLDDIPCQDRRPVVFLSRQVSDSFLKNVLDTSLSKIGETLQQRAQTISYRSLYENNFLSNFELG